MNTNVYHCNPSPSLSLSLSLSLQGLFHSCSHVSTTPRPTWGRAYPTFSVESAKTHLTSSSTPPSLEPLAEPRKRHPFQEVRFPPIFLRSFVFSPYLTPTLRIFTQILSFIRPCSKIMYFHLISLYDCQDATIFLLNEICSRTYPPNFPLQVQGTSKKIARGERAISKSEVETLERTFPLLTQSIPTRRMVI